MTAAANDQAPAKAPAEKVEGKDTPAQKSEGVANFVRDISKGPQAAVSGTVNGETSLGATGILVIPHPGPLYNEAAALSGMKPPGQTESGEKKGSDSARDATGTVPRSDAPVAPGEQAPKKPGDGSDRQPKIESLLAGDPALAAQVKEMRGHLDGMREPQRSAAQKDLDAMLLRGTAGYTAERSGPDATKEQKAELASNPALSSGEITKTLDSLNRAMRANPGELSPQMGNDPSERANNRDLIVAQSLRNFGDTRGIQQSSHQTCLLDSKIADEARHNPHVAAEMMTRAMTSQTGEVTMMDGKTRVKLDSSWMTPDSEAKSSIGGDHAHGMSGDVRMLTGLYANALTQHRPDGHNQIFVMSRGGLEATHSADSGDRLIDMQTGRAQMTGGHYADSPNVGGDDSVRLSGMTKDGGIMATNATAWGVENRGSENFRDIRNEQQLAALVREHGNVQVGLNANILFKGTAIGAEGGGHATSITECRQGPDGKIQFHIQDTNEGTSGWYSSETIMAAINNDKTYRAGQAPLIDQPGRQQPGSTELPAAERGHFPGIEQPGGPRVSEPVANPHGFVTEGEQQQLQNLRPETDTEQKARHELERQQEEEAKRRAELLKLQENQQDDVQKQKVKSQQEETQRILEKEERERLEREKRGD
jgi:hypothetical protein